MKINIILYFTLLHTSLGFYISSLEEKKSPTNIVKTKKDKQIVLHNIFTSKNSKFHKKRGLPYNILESYGQSRFDDVNLNDEHGLNDKYNKQHLGLLKIKQSKYILKNGNSIQNLNRKRRKVEEIMDSDLSSENIGGFLKKLDFNTPNDDDDDYRDVESYNNSNMNPDYSYENLYDDEEDISLSVKSRKNLEYGSFQDLILQANYNQLKQNSEEMKLQSIGNESFG